MFALDLFNTKYEKELLEGAVDNTQAHLMEPLSQRAAEIRTQLRNKNLKSSELKNLEREYEDLVDKRMKILRGEITSQDECMGYGNLGEELSSDEFAQRMSQLGKDADADIKQSMNKQSNDRIAALKNPPKSKSFMQQVGDKQIGMVKGAWKGLTGAVEESDAPAQRPSGSPWAHVKGGAPNKGIGDLQDPQEKMAQLRQKAKKGPLANVGSGLKAFFKGEPEPMDEQEDEAQAQQELGAGFGVYQALLNAWNDKKPYVVVPMPGGQNLSITRNQIFNVLYALKNMNDNAFKKTISTAFSNLDKFMVWSNSIKRYQLPAEKPPQGAPGQMKLFKEAGQKKNSEKAVAPQSPEVDRYLTKVRRASPNATSDLEAIAKDELEKQARVNKNIDDLEQTNARQDAALKKAMTLDRQQGNEIDDVEQQINQLAQRVQSIKAAKPVAGQAPSAEPQTLTTTPTTTEPSSKAPEVKSDEPKDQPTTVKVPQPIYIVEPEKLPQKDQEIYSQVKNLEKELNNKIQGINSWGKATQTDDKSRNELNALRKDMERTRNEIDQKIEKLEKSGAKVQRAKPAQQQNKATPASSIKRNLNKALGAHNPLPVSTAPDEDVVGNMIDPEKYDQLVNNLGREPATVEESTMSELDAMRQDLENMSERQFYAAYGISKAAFQQKYRTLLKPAEPQDTPLDEGQRLHRGDPIVVTAPNEFEGKTGEIYDFSPSGTFVIVDLYNHGKHSMHLSDVEYNQYADTQDDEDDWYDDVAEGYQDFNKVEPYAVCLAGKPVKKFDYYEEARRFHDNWKQKLYREGDKAKADTITLMPLNLDEMDKSQTPPGRAGDYPLGVKGTTGKPVTAKKVVKDLTKDLDQAFGKEKKVKEEQGRVDPILIKALNRMPDGLATHGEVLNACYDAYAMELGRMEMKSNYGTTHAYVPQLMDLYKQKHGLTFKEAANPAQQAAIAIAMKKAGKKPKSVDETALNTRDPAGDYAAKRKALQDLGMNKDVDQQAVLQRRLDLDREAKARGIAEDTGSWIVYDPATKQIKKRFKTHTAGKSYAKTHGLGFASSEYYFDNIKDQKALAELDVNTLKSYADKRGAQVAAMKADNPDATPGGKEWVKMAVPAQHVGRAKQKIARKERQQGVAENDDWDDGEWEDIPDTHVSVQTKQPARYPEHVLRAIERNPSMRADIIADYERKQGVAETVTDVKAEMARVYRKLAPKIERHRDSFLAGQLYDELENIAELHGTESEFKRMIAGARNRAHMDYDTNPGGFQNWFWYLPFADEELSEESTTSSDAVERAIIHRIMVDDKLRNMAMDIGTDKVFQAVEEVAYNVGDVDEIGSSDVSGWVNQVKQLLGVEA
jgi:hypothetical protein